MTDQHTPTDGDFTFREARSAFEEAMKTGRIKRSEVHQYMYLGTKNGRDLFKHIDTRQYLP